MSKIIVIRGNSGSGKTTIAKELQKELGHGTMLISQDVIRREIMYVKDRPNNKAIDLLHNLVAFAHKNCDIAILEGILYLELYRSLFAFISDMYANNIYAYYFDLPFEETLKRHHQKPNSSDFGEAQLQQWWREKDYMEDISEKTLDNGMSKEYIVNLILNDIHSCM